MKITQELDRRITDYFTSHQSEIIETIFRLVRLKSVTEFRKPPHPYGEDCARVLEEAIQIADELGFQTQNFDYHAATADFGDPDHAIGLGVHLDVVPEGEGWQICPPYAPVVHEGYLVGRGVADDKGPAVLSLYVAKCIQALELPMRHGIKVIMGCNEEKGSNCVGYYVEHAKNPPVFSIVPDSTFPVTNGEKGMVFLTLKTGVLEGNIVEAGGGTVSNTVADSAYVILSGVTADRLPPMGDRLRAEDVEAGVRVTATGVSAHAAEPERGVDAIGLLFRYLRDHALVAGTQRAAVDAIMRICGDCNGEAFGVPLEDAPSGKLTHVLGVLRLEEGRFVLECNMRYPVTVSDPGPMETAIRAAAAEMGCEVAFYKNVKPGYVPAETQAVQTLMAVYHRVCDDNSLPAISGGGTYARVLPNAVAYGCAFPGQKSPFGDERGGMHQPDECVSVEHLLKAGRILTQAVLALDDILDA